MVTLPLRDQPTIVPPMGALSTMSYLRRHGLEDVELYDMDALRPAHAEALDHIVARRPHVLGINGRVSTTYAMARRLCLDARERLDDTLVVVFGKLAASAEVLLRRTGADLCVLGEAERVMLNIARRAATTREAAAFSDIAGVALLDEAGELVNTGYERPLDSSDLYDIHWRDLERSGSIHKYIFPFFQDGEFQVEARVPDSVKSFSRDPRTYQPHRRDKNYCTLNTSRGCVARCTFCPRWVKGIRVVPPALAVARVEQLVRDHHVGFITFGDENFGTDHRWLREFCQRLAPLDVLWTVAGMRVNRVDAEIIAMMRDAGCCAIYYGTESGSADMLQVMEKKVSLEANRDALRWTVDAGLNSIIQIVLRMPGETQRTVRETVEFCKAGSTLSPRQNPAQLSVFFAQTLPGSPLYEYARRVGLIGPTLDEEERYLLAISDQTAVDPSTSLNHSVYPALTTLCWPFMIRTEVNYAYVKKFGLDHFWHHVFDRTHGPVTASGRRTGQQTFRPPSLWRTLWSRLSAKPPHRRVPISHAHPVLMYRLRRLGMLFTLARASRQHGLPHARALVEEYLRHRLTSAKNRFGHQYVSLRKLVASGMEPLAGDTPEMLPLRRGR